MTQQDCPNCTAKTPTQPKMEIGVAIELLRYGKRIRRRSWSNSAAFLVVHNAGYKLRLAEDATPLDVPLFIGLKRGEKLIPWIPSTDDLFASDWKEYTQADEDAEDNICWSCGRGR